MAMATHPPPPYVWNYLPLALQILAALGLAGGMVGASFLVGKHKNSRTKLGAYECGMDPIGDARGRFSVRFYMVAMLFILLCRGRLHAALGGHLPPPARAYRREQMVRVQ
jgi:hypothetical protein